MVQGRAMFTIANQQIYDLSNGAIFNDLERPLSPVSRSRYFWRWISQKRYDIYNIVSMEY